MSIFICWVLFPIVFCLLSLGCGLFVQWVSGARMAGVLLLPVGYATIVVASQCTTYFDATTFLTTPLVLALALAGLALGRKSVWPVACGLWPMASATGVFLIYAAPVVLTGSATFLGYTLLGDTSIHFTLIDWVMKHGFHTVPAGPPSSTHAVLASYLGTAYPLGAHTALGAVRPLVGQDVAWVFQPYLALLATFTALGIYSVLSRAISEAWLVALGAFLAAQSGLVYAYALEGSIKEMATICLLAMVVATGAEYVARRGGLRAVVPLAVVTAAAMGVLNASIVPWLGPILVAVLVALLAARGLSTWRGAAVEAGIFATVAAALSFPALASVGDFVRDTTATFTSTANFGVQYGNLIQPLSKWQAFGIWPVGDFRLRLTSHVAITYVLIGVVILAIVLGVPWAMRRGRGWPLVFLATSLIGSVYVTARSTPWGDAKALMIVSPAIMAVAILGIAFLWQAGRRPAALLVAGAIAFGVLWTNALAYHYADVAPRPRLAELGKIGDRFAGQGPTLYTEFEEFAKHFLHRGDPSGSDESWQDNPRGELASGGPAPYAVSTEVDALAPAYVQRFRTLVLRRSGSAGRPPSNYRLAYSGRFYDVWQKTSPGVVRHLPLGDSLQPGAVPNCSSVRALSTAGGTRLAYVERPRLPVLIPSQARHPRGWKVDGADPTALHPTGPGTVTGSVAVDTAGRYRIWVRSSSGRGYTVVVDGRRAGELERAVNPRGSFETAGSVTLSPGSHVVQLVRPGGSLYPGDGGGNRLLGALVLAPSTDSVRIRELPNSQWRTLCGRRLDWIESVR